MSFDDEWIIVTPAETIEQRRIRKSEIVSYGKMSRYVYLYTHPLEDSKGFPIQDSLETIDRAFGKPEGNPYTQHPVVLDDIRNDARNCLNCYDFNQTLERCQKAKHIFDEGRPENYYCNKWKGR